MKHDKEWYEVVRQLLTHQRLASLATINAKHSPFLSLVPYAIDTREKGFLIHISELAVHSANLAQNGEDVSLMVTEAEPVSGPVHALVRLSMQVHAQFIEKKSHAADFDHAKNTYSKRFPEAAFMFDFADFHLVRLRPTELRLVAGFGAARNVKVTQFEALLESL